MRAVQRDKPPHPGSRHRAIRARRHGLDERVFESRRLGRLQLV